MSEKTFFYITTFTFLGIWGCILFLAPDFPIQVIMHIVTGWWIGCVWVDYIYPKLRQKFYS